MSDDLKLLETLNAQRIHHMSQIMQQGCVWLSLFLFGQWVMLAVFLKVIGAW